MVAYFVGCRDVIHNCLSMRELIPTRRNSFHPNTTNTLHILPRASTISPMTLYTVLTRVSSLTPT